MRGPGNRHDPLDTSAEVETPEHVRFRYQLAGPTRRALAWGIDMLVRGAILLIFLLVALFAGVDPDDAYSSASLGFMLLIAFVVEWGYFVFFETLNRGRSPGKQAVGIRVVTEGGHPLRVVDSLLRNLLRAADFLPLGYAIGVVVMARDPKFRRLGDMVAGTMVVLEEARKMSRAIQVHPPPSPEELAAFPQRVVLSGEELEAVELFLRRAPDLPPTRIDELADMIAPTLSRRLALRYRDAARFLALLYWKARERSGPG